MCDIFKGYSDLALCTRKTNATAPSGRSCWPSRICCGSKSSQRFQWATLSDLSPLHSLTWASFSLSWDRGIDKLWVNYWDQMPIRKESVSKFQAELGGTMISNNDGSWWGKQSPVNHCTLSLPHLSTKGYSRQIISILREEKGYQNRPTSLPLKYLSFFFFFLLKYKDADTKTQVHQEEKPSSNIRQWKGLSVSRPKWKASYMQVCPERLTCGPWTLFLHSHEGYVPRVRLSFGRAQDHRSFSS